MSPSPTVRNIASEKCCRPTIDRLLYLDNSNYKCMNRVKLSRNIFFLRFFVIEASLSEPHIDEKYMRESYIYTSVTRAPPYTKSIGRMKYLAMINPR